MRLAAGIDGFTLISIREQQRAFNNSPSCKFYTCDGTILHYNAFHSLSKRIFLRPKKRTRSARSTGMLSDPSLTYHNPHSDMKRHIWAKAQLGHDGFWFPWLPGILKALVFQMASQRIPAPGHSPIFQEPRRITICIHPGGCSMSHKAATDQERLLPLLRTLD